MSATSHFFFAFSISFPFSSYSSRPSFFLFLISFSLFEFLSAIPLSLVSSPSPLLRLSFVHDFSLFTIATRKVTAARAARNAFLRLGWRQTRLPARDWLADRTCQSALVIPKQTFPDEWKGPGRCRMKRFWCTECETWKFIPMTRLKVRVFENRQIRESMRRGKWENRSMMYFSCCNAWSSDTCLHNIPRSIYNFSFRKKE